MTSTDTQDEETRAAEALVAEEERERTETFDASRYIVNLNGRGNYLEVKYRLLWLRRAHPDAAIATEMVAGSIDEKYAVFKATVSIPGRGSATGFKQETQGDFRDFLEKAETGAIGRALAALGFGTQFCDDHDYGGQNIGQRFAQQQHAVVDAPVSRRVVADDWRGGPRQRQTIGRPREQPNSGVGPNAADATVATERQIKFIHVLARESGLDEDELATWSQELYGKEVDKLGRRDAGNLIEALQRRRNEVS